MQKLVQVPYFYNHCGIIGHTVQIISNGLLARMRIVSNHRAKSKAIGPNAFVMRVD